MFFYKFSPGYFKTPIGSIFRENTLEESRKWQSNLDPYLVEKTSRNNIVYSYVDIVNDSKF